MAVTQQYRMLKTISNAWQVAVIAGESNVHCVRTSATQRPGDGGNQRCSRGSTRRTCASYSSAPQCIEFHTEGRNPRKRLQVRMSCRAPETPGSKQHDCQETTTPAHCPNIYQSASWSKGLSWPRRRPAHGPDHHASFLRSQRKQTSTSTYTQALAVRRTRPLRNMGHCLPTPCSSVPCPES